VAKDRTATFRDPAEVIRRRPRNKYSPEKRLSAYRGSILLDFWATWCGGCKTEIPWYIEFQNNYRDAGLFAVGVSMDADGWKSVKPFLAEPKLNYPVVIGNDDLGEQFGVINMPLTLLIDRNGKIAESPGWWTRRILRIRFAVS
jgi:thiol-disulfide isomerase/thioredoxin